METAVYRRTLKYFAAVVPGLYIGSKLTFELLSEGQESSDTQASLGEKEAAPSRE